MKLSGEYKLKEIRNGELGNEDDEIVKVEDGIPQEEDKQENESLGYEQLLEFFQRQESKLKELK